MDYNNTLNRHSNMSGPFSDSHVDEKLIYHNRTHTEKLVEAAIGIAQHYQLNEGIFL